MRQQHTGPTLPKELRDQIGDFTGRRSNGRSKGRSLGGSSNRKDRRKAERQANKVSIRYPRKAINHASQPLQTEVGLIGKDQDDTDFSDDAVHEALAVENRSSKEDFQRGSRVADKISLSPPPPPKASRGVQAQLEQDDVEIARLEKKLGRKRRVADSTSELDLDDLFGNLGDLDSDGDNHVIDSLKRKDSSDDVWLANKRRKACGKATVNETMAGEANSKGEEMSDSGEEELYENQHRSGPKEDADSVESEELNSDEGHEEFEGFSSGDLDVVEAPRIRENPYIAPMTAEKPQRGKYIPPALRGPSTSDAETVARLKRQIQGLLNRLSDANMLTILRDIEQIYQNNPRSYVTTTLINLLIGILADEAVLNDTFLILHAGYIAAVYKVIGADFCAQMIERITEEFDQHYSRNKSGIGKQTTNLITVLAQLYCFQVVGSKLIFDYIKLCLQKLSEINTEILLRLIRVSGAQLRQDDPTSLKDIVILLQKSMTAADEETLSVRTKFMVETINDLKNNRMRTGLNASSVASEHTNRMKKQLGSLNARNLKGTEPLRIGLADMRDADKRGKWWIVGASWRENNNEQTSSSDNGRKSQQKDELGQLEETGEVDLLQLAKEQRMNTDIRRAIFITIMSATDAKDAYVRLMKMNLKKAQFMEIPRVVVHCAGCESAYNPYYTLLAQKFCSDHRSRKCFQFILWDVFKTLGEKDDEADTSDEEGSHFERDMSLRKLVNLGKLYGALIARNTLSITSLKTLDFALLKPKTRTLIEILLVTVMLESQKGERVKDDGNALLSIFVNVDGATGMVAGLQYFLKNVVSRTKITANKKEMEIVKRGCKSVITMLQRLMASTSLNED